MKPKQLPKKVKSFYFGRMLILYFVESLLLWKDVGDVQTLSRFSPSVLTLLIFYHWQQQILTQQKSLTLPLIHDDERNCFRVRSQLHKYCVDKSYWSEWSRPNCYPGNVVLLQKHCIKNTNAVPALAMLGALDPQGVYSTCPTLINTCIARN